MLPLLVLIVCTMDAFSTGTFTLNFDNRVSGKVAPVYTPSIARSFTTLQFDRSVVLSAVPVTKKGLNLSTSLAQAASFITNKEYSRLSSLRSYTLRQNKFV